MNVVPLNRENIKRTLSARESMLHMGVVRPSSMSRPRVSNLTARR